MSIALAPVRKARARGDDRQRTMPVLLVYKTDTEAFIRLPWGRETIDCWNVPAVRGLAAKIAKRLRRPLDVEVWY